MYKIMIHIDTHTNDTWFYYQEEGKDYVANSLEEIRETVLTLIDVYGEDYIKIVKQETGDDMNGSVETFLYDSTDNYEELVNRPFINGVEIIGALSLADLGIQPAGNYATNERVDALEGTVNNIDFSPYATNERVNQVEAKVDAIDLEPYATMDYLDEVVASIDFSASNENITGVKTFSVLPRSTVMPTTEDELTNKSYVDHGVENCASKEYVDTAISNIKIPEVNLDGYATTKYVDDAVANIDVPDVDLTDYYNKAEVDQAISEIQMSDEVMAEMSTFEEDEHVIGTWIDGKPLYRKVLTTYDVVENQINFSMAHGVSGWDKMWVDLGNSFYYESIRKRSLPMEQTFYTSSTGTDMCHVYIEGDYVYIVSRGGWGVGWLKVITLLYTKTADEPTELRYYPITQEAIDASIAAAIGNVLEGEY